MKAKQIALSLLLFTLFFASSSASAQVSTFVASTGSDLNPCSRTAPCRNFQAAVNVVQPGGEVVALDSAEFGSISIAKAVSVIAAPGVHAAVTATSGNGVSINAGAKDTIALRGLTIIGHGGFAGISFSSGETLHIESCLVSGFSGVPASVKVGVSFVGSGNLEVKDSLMRSNDVGILVKPTTGTALVTIDHVRLEGGLAGLAPRGGSKVTVRHSLAADNGTGFSVGSDAAPVELTLEDCVVSNNIDGISAEGSPSGALVIVRVSNSTVTTNSNGMVNLGGAGVLSRGNNTIEGNGTDTVGVIGSYSAK